MIRNPNVNEEFGTVYSVQRRGSTSTSTNVRITGSIKGISSALSMSIYQFGTVNCSAAEALLDGLGNIDLEAEAAENISVVAEAEKFPLVGPIRPKSIIERTLMLRLRDQEHSAGKLNLR